MKQSYSVYMRNDDIKFCSESSKRYIKILNSRNIRKEQIKSFKNKKPFKKQLEDDVILNDNSILLSNREKELQIKKTNKANVNKLHYESTKLKNKSGNYNGLSETLYTISEESSYDRDVC